VSAEPAVDNSRHGVRALMLRVAAGDKGAAKELARHDRDTLARLKRAVKEKQPGSVARLHSYETRMKERLSPSAYVEAERKRKQQAARRDAERRRNKKTQPETTATVETTQHETTQPQPASKPRSHYAQIRDAAAHGDPAAVKRFERYKAQQRAYQRKYHARPGPKAKAAATETAGTESMSFPLDIIPERHPTPTARRSINGTARTITASTQREFIAIALIQAVTKILKLDE